MRATTLLNLLLNLPGLWVRRCEIHGDELVVNIRRRFRILTCPDCGTQVKGRFSKSKRRWRHLSIGAFKTYIRGSIRRLRCPNCQAVKTERVPWARPGARFTRPFEDAVGFLAQKLDKTAVAELTGIAWVTVGQIAERLVAEKLPEDRLEGLTKIGVDEISYRKHHKYLTVVVDHEKGGVVWVGAGKSAKTLKEFFEELGPERAKTIELVSIDMSAAYEKAIRESLPNAKIVFDRFHVAKLAQDAVTEVRREAMRELASEEKRWLKKSRWILLKRPENRTEKEDDRLSMIKKTNGPVYRAYLLKESFLNIFVRDTREQAEEDLRAWLKWAARSRLKPFVRLGRTIRKYWDGVLEFIETKLNNGRLEGMNNKIRLLSHRSYGFHSAKALIATIYLCCSKVELPQLQIL